MESYRNKNRGYQQLRVWQDAIRFYVLSCKVFRKLPYDLRRVVTQAVASADSIHRNIAEGYCRRTLREYLNFLNYALGSTGESVSGLIAYREADRLTEAEFNELNDLAFKLENGLLRLVNSLEKKQPSSDWVDHLMLKESNEIYTVEMQDDVSGGPSLHPSITPSLHHSITPPLHPSILDP